MDKIVEPPPIKLRPASVHRGLRKLSPDLISKAIDETNAQIIRIGLTFLGTAAFCLLSLLSPDSALLGGTEKINVPLAGPVSFIGFMLLGPAVLIMLRIYLQIYVEHSNRLDRLVRSVPAVRTPTLVPLKNPLIRVLSALTFCVLLPVTLMLFAWKAAVFPRWGAGLFSVAVAVIMGHVMLPLSRFTWRSRASLSVGAAVLVWALTTGDLRELLRRPFDLHRANLSGQWLVKEDLSGASLSYTNLSGAKLENARLSLAGLGGANLKGADLSQADLRGAFLIFANLSGAHLNGAKLGKADKFQTNLVGVNLSEADLSSSDIIDPRTGGTDLSEASMSFANLTGANLSFTNLSSANLVGAKLENADLRDANLRHAVLSTAKLGNADLRHANLSWANLRAADLSKANLSGANLSDADLRDANLSKADLSSTTNLIQRQLDKACGNEQTKLPEGLALKPCTDSLQD